MSAIFQLCRDLNDLNDIVRSVDDSARLQYVSNIVGDVVGRVLFRKTLDLPTVLEVAEAPPEPVADVQ